MQWLQPMIWSFLGFGAGVAILLVVDAVTETVRYVRWRRSRRAAAVHKIRSQKHRKKVSDEQSQVYPPLPGSQ